MNVARGARFQNPVCVVLAVLLFCGRPMRAHVSSQDAAALPIYRELTDETGRTVRVPQPVRRIVSLAPSLTETIYALGLQERLVGDTDFCDYPPDAQRKTKVGGAINPSLEKIATLRPDLVLVTKALNRLETVRSLEALGIASYATDPHSVAEILSSTQRLADALGARELGASVVEDLKHRLAELQERLRALPPRRVLFVVWTEPLISIGKDTFIADALRQAGAVSIVESTQSWPQVNLEEIVRLQPEFLVFANAHLESTSRDFDAIAGLPGWRLLEAVRNRRYAIVNEAVNRPAPRIITAIEDLARQLHPDAFVEPPNIKRENGQDHSPVSRQLPHDSARALQFAGGDAGGQEHCLCAR
ncbi:MAG TPA: cobalamin-binding protein [Candidatus Dormibacteraeota bacterium]|nr:cobalamin-binding protein [Candidatus Dormibacteraeota bacterium]